MPPPTHKKHPYSCLAGYPAAVLPTARTSPKITGCPDNQLLEYVSIQLPVLPASAGSPSFNISIYSGPSFPSLYPSSPIRTPAYKYRASSTSIQIQINK